jgi:hypothetical protein
MPGFSIDTFKSHIQSVTSAIAGLALDDALEQKLTEQFPPDSTVVQAIREACFAGIDAGVVCKYEAAGIRYGRVIKPSEDLAGYSVDVVHMQDVAGPHHRHPSGEIDLIMPISGSAKFDGRDAGWLVYGPDSAHRPTVSEGEALVLYLLPNGEIEFTGN